MKLKAMKNDPSASTNALSYPGFLLEVGEGRARETKGNLIDLPPYVTSVKKSSELIDNVFPDIHVRYKTFLA